MSMESSNYGLWVAVQAGGRGAPADMTVGDKKPRWVGGDIQANRDDGTEPFSDSTLFGDTVDFVNTLQGNGAPVIQAQSGVLAYLTWLAAGQENVTGGVDAQQTVSSTATGGGSKLNLNGFVTGTIDHASTAAAMQAALLAATNPVGETLPAASITCAGGPLPGTPIVVTFTGALGKQPVPPMTVDNTGATGGVMAVAGATRTGSGFAHEISPSDDGGFYSTWVKRVGSTVVARHQFNDVRIATQRWEGSSASKVLKVTPTWLSFDPGIILDTDPTKTDDGTIPFIWTETAGAIEIDGQVYRGSSSFAAESQWALTPWYGDDVTPYDVVMGRATLVLQGITILLDAQGLTRYNTQLYNDPDPPADAKPVKGIPALGSYSNLYSRINKYTGGVSESFRFEAPFVKWDPNLNIPASPAGGPVELPLAAEQRKDPAGVEPAWRITVTTPNDPAFVG